MALLKSHQVVVAAGTDVTLAPEVREAIDEAYEKGFDAGREEAGIARTEAMAALAAALESSGAAQMGAAESRVALDAETIVALAADLATWFVEGAVTAHPGALVAAAENVLAHTSGALSVELFVHPDVVDAVDEISPPGVDVRGDVSLAPSDHRIVVGEMSVERIWAAAIVDVGPAIAAAVESAR
jgi:flagellar biosynthesis/type III secretory pathway protein FliH